MARTPRYERTRWIVLVGASISVGIHLLIGLAWYLGYKPPLPKLVLHVSGQDGARVTSSPAGIDCGDDCTIELDRGTAVTLTVLLPEKSVIGEWTGCEVNPQLKLECGTVLQGDVQHVHVRIDAVPDKPDKDEEEPPDIVAEDVEQEEDVTVALTDETFTPMPIAELMPEPEAPEVVPEPPQVEPPPEVAVLEPPPPEIPNPVPPPEEQAPEPKPKPPPPPPELKSVEVPDENEVEKAPDDAQFLSDKDRNVLEETRAEDTNLEKQADGERAHSEESTVVADNVGAEEDEIAQLEDVEATSFDAERTDERETRGEIADGVVPKGEEGDRGEAGDQGTGAAADTPGVLAMRGIDGRGAPGGPVVDAERDPEPGGKAGKRGKRGRRGIKTQLEFEDYERIVGVEEADREAELGKRKISKRRGRWEQKQAAVKAALENFVPEVRPGNQTALKTRKAPFALYINRMHRRIHELWGFGFLDELDSKSATDPLNNWKLVTLLEIAINPDGTIHKTTIANPSGILMFDVAAIDTVYTAGPFEETPEEIRSVDGRVYLQWEFRRDHEQCGTHNVRMYILDKVSDSKHDDGEMVRKAREGMAPRGRRSPADASRTPPEGDAAASARAHANLPAPDDPHAEHAANLWMTGLSKRNVDKMIGVTGVPFSSGDKVIANSLAEVGAVYRNLLGELRGPIRDHKLLSPAGYRKLFGTLPAGVGLSAGHLLLALQVGNERFTLVLKRGGDDSYKIVALHR